MKFDFFGGLTSDIFAIANKFVTDKDSQIKLQFELNKALLKHQATIYEAQSKIIIAEATGSSWLQRNWRPIMMLSFVSIFINNYILVPWLMAFGVNTVAVLDIPNGMWNVLTVGIGGYIAGRSGEKIMKEYKKV